MVANTLTNTSTHSHSKTSPTSVSPTVFSVRLRTSHLPLLLVGTLGEFTSSDCTVRGASLEQTALQLASITTR